MTYHDLFFELTVFEDDDDAFFFTESAMFFEKKITGSKPKWKDPVPHYIYTYLDKKFGVRL